MSPVSKPRKKKKKSTPSKPKAPITYVCLLCDAKEKIPYAVVREFDRMDGGDPSVPPMFSCEKCDVQMYPEYYKGIHGIEYRLTDMK